jgi:hypothetical protein
VASDPEQFHDRLGQAFRLWTVREGKKSEVDEWRWTAREIKWIDVRIGRSLRGQTLKSECLFARKEYVRLDVNPGRVDKYQLTAANQ